MTNTEFLKSLQYELSNLNTVLNMSVRGETADEKVMYMLGRRDAASYFLSAIIDGIIDQLEKKDKEKEEWQHSTTSTPESKTSSATDW